MPIFCFNLINPNTTFFLYKLSLVTALDWLQQLGTGFLKDRLCIQPVLTGVSALESVKRLAFQKAGFRPAFGLRLGFWAQVVIYIGVQKPLHISYCSTFQPLCVSHSHLVNFSVFCLTVIINLF